MDLHIPVVSYFETFCQSLEVERDPHTSVIDSFCQTLEAEGDSLTLTDLDSGDIQTMDHHVWDKDVDQWLDDLIDVMEDSLEDSLEDIGDLLEDMSPEDWDYMIEDVLDQFDLDAFVS